MDQQEVLEQQNEATQETAQEAQPVQTEQAATNEYEPETMQEALDKYGENVHLRRGEIRTGTVISKSENGFLVDIGFKCEGVLPMKEYTNHSLIETEPEPNPGDQIEVEVVSVRDGDDAQLLLSRWKHEFDKRWAKLDALAAENQIMTVKGVGRVKGGLMVESCGLEGFIPVSHLTLAGRNVNPSNFIGQNIKVKILDHDKRKRRLVFSRRELLEAAENERKAKFYDRVHEGDIIEGEVSSLTDFGVFVNLGEMDGLVHLTEITWKRSFKLRDMFKKGDKVTVKVTGIDKEKDRISLSIKQVSGDPWDTVADKIHKGDVFKGTVTNLTEFGAFVELEPGIEGLVHVGDISWARIKKPRDVLKKGQELDVVVLDIDVEKKRISLGSKQLHDPWNEADKRYLPGQDIKVKVVRLAEFGAFVEVEEGVEALIHISQLSRKRVEKPADILKEGDEVTARVLEVNPEQRRMRLSLAALEPEPEPEPVSEPEEKEQRKPEPKPERQEHPERAERRERKGKSRARAIKEAGGYEDDEEMLEYNPFAEAFKDANWNN
ncbi:MAG: S1 RNA-binding domain-containing protein [Synergistales bacterium]|nr:S1 RNA-binding domain-containing protein [Synergistales bacterium]MDY6404745.1 S1 RNA-binding domain-containing protein [Synergistales bacterium]MDY6409951.1 S1 RNA-binding domain-containing protein [Synergistales bacterium]MDY6414503.1 S1 RNA-binding domain-containing protein [Synergistales bacterium]MDY6422347.1 S1 RNA-binding domain-containing protein [Synergistales bacterium]